MRNFRVLQVLILVIGLTGGGRILFFIRENQLEQVFYAFAVTAWALWVTAAISRNWNLPAPFGFRGGTNQVARIGYCVLVNAIFFFVILRA